VDFEVKDAERLPLDLIASRLPDEEVFFQKMTALVWEMTQTMFSGKVIIPGKTRTSDLVWWWRQRVNDQGLGTWFQPSVDVQRQGSAPLEADPIVQPATCCIATSASPSRDSIRTRSTSPTFLKPAKRTRPPASSAPSPTRMQCRT
jgi:hypothetical protein